MTGMALGNHRARTPHYNGAHSRAIYDNLAKYIRFQMGMLSAFIISYLGAAIFMILGGVPFSPLAVLWANFLVQVPIAVALGFDKLSPDLMERKPRPLTQPVLTGAQWVRLVFTGLLVALGTLIVEYAYTPVLNAEGVSVTATMGFVVFSLFNVAVGLSARSETGTVFTADTLADQRQLKLYGLALLLIVFGAEFNLGQRILGTVSLTGQQWFVCIALAFALLPIDEVVKFFMRRARRSTRFRAGAWARPVTLRRNLGVRVRFLFGESFKTSK